jgi:endonuclease/exonuclease/phosphatase family metal-dependent hydrolase
MRRVIALAILIALLAACSPSAPATPNPTPTAVPQVSVRIVSYNILYGAGIDPGWYEHVSLSRRKDRTPELFAYLRELDADVVALQEVYGWDDSQPPFIATAARELGLPNYYVADSASDHDTAILTRYEILEAETVMRDTGSPGILRARLRTPDGNPLNVFVVHLDPFQDDARFCELDVLLEAVQPYRDERTILLGDFNFRPKTDAGEVSPELTYLREAGLDMVAHDNTQLRDYIWVPKTSPAWTGRTWFRNPANYQLISDHTPIGVQFDFLPYPAVTAPEPAAAGRVEVPALLQEKLSGAQVAAANDFENACRNRLWYPQDPQPDIRDGSLIVTGKENWGTSVFLSGNIKPGGGAVLRFRASKGSEYSALLASDGEWGQESYRELGLYAWEEQIHPFRTIGSQGITGEEMAILQSDHEYYLALLVDQAADLHACVWDPSDPAIQYDFLLETDENFRENTWIVIIGANKGLITIEEFMRLTFDGFR